jgi:hypothetical protein
MDRLTVLVFKDNNVARTFRVPLRWITQFSWILIAFLILSTAGVGFGVYGYVHRLTPITISRPSFGSGDSGRVAELEKKIQELEAKKMTAPSAADSKSTAEPEQVAPGPVFPQEPTVGTLTDLSLKLPLFKALPDAVKTAPADPGTLPVEITEQRVRWEGNQLKIHFALLYKNPGQGTQQGRIILLARGPSMLMAYPKRSLYSADHEVLLDTNQGEYFSVGRFREVKASFGPVSDHSELTEVEAIIIGQDGQLLFHRRFAPGQTTAQKLAPKPVAAKPAPKEKDEDEDETETTNTPAAAVAPSSAPGPVGNVNPADTKSTPDQGDNE